MPFPLVFDEKWLSPRRRKDTQHAKRDDCRKAPDDEFPYAEPAGSESGGNAWFDGRRFLRSLPNEERSVLLQDV
jgi:DNA-directed RNA polymerase specialized sigma24 family protein